jgi:hypothetical protein
MGPPILLSELRDGIVGLVRRLGVPLVTADQGILTGAPDVTMPL